MRYVPAKCKDISNRSLQGLACTLVGLLALASGSKPRPWCLDGSALCRGLAGPTERLGHTITLLPANKAETHQLQAVIMGGQRSLYASSVLPLTSMELVNMEDMTLRTQAAAFALPANVTMRPRSGHAVLPYRNYQLLLFGGVTYNRAEALTAVATNDVMLMDWGSSARTGGDDSVPTWRALYNRTTGGGADPVPRQRAAAAVVGEALWVYGGLDNSSRILNGTFRFNITRGRWRRIPTNVSGSVFPCDSNGVSGLQRAAMVASPSGRFLLLYGGRNETDFPQNGLWLLDTANLTADWAWIQVNLTFPGSATDLNLPGYDSTMRFVRTASGGLELLIAAVGAWKTSPKVRSASWQQWVNVIRSETSGALEVALARAAETRGAVPLPFSRRRIFISSAPNTPVYLPDNTRFVVGANERRPFPSQLPWVRDAAMALTPDGQQLFITGGNENDKASTKFLILNLERGSVVDADSSLRPDYVQTSTNSLVFRHAVHVTVPTNLTTWRPNDPTVMSDLLLFTGLDNINDESDPRFGEVRLLDAADQETVASCSSTNVQASADSCKVLPLPRGNTAVGNLPPPRDGAALAALHQVFHWRNATYGTDVGAVVLLMYGGMSTVGQVLNSTDTIDKVDEALSAGEQQVRAVLEMCEASISAASSSGGGASNTLDSEQQLDEKARCSYAALQQEPPQGLCPNSPGEGEYYATYAYDYEVYDYSYDRNQNDNGTDGGDGNEPPAAPETSQPTSAPPPAPPPVRGGSSSLPMPLGTPPASPPLAPSLSAQPAAPPPLVPGGWSSPPATPESFKAAPPPQLGPSIAAPPMAPPSPPAARRRALLLAPTPGSEIADWEVVHASCQGDEAFSLRPRSRKGRRHSDGQSTEGELRDDKRSGLTAGHSSAAADDEPSEEKAREAVGGRTVGRRRWLRGQQHQRQRWHGSTVPRTLLSATDGAAAPRADGTAAAAAQAAADAGWGNRAAAAVAAAAAAAAVAAADSGGAGRRAQKDGSDGFYSGSMPEVYDTSYAVLAHLRGLAATPLVDLSRGYAHKGGLAPLVVGSGPAFVVDKLRNVNGSSQHSPGPRAAASLTGLPFIGLNNTDGLLFGGLTAVNRTPDNPTGQPLLTNDIHYLQFIPAVTALAAALNPAAAPLPPPRFPPCPFNATGVTCKYVSPFATRGAAADAPPPPQLDAPPPPLPPEVDLFAPYDGVPLFLDCPFPGTTVVRGSAASASGPARMGTYQLRVWRSARRDVTRGMGLTFISMDSNFRLVMNDIGRDVAQGPCCPANNTQWAWPLSTTSGNGSSADSPPASYSASTYVSLPTEFLVVKLVSGGNGWTAREDQQAPLLCDPVAAPERCPRIDIYSVDAGRTVAGFGNGGSFAVWAEPSNVTNRFERYVRLALCQLPRQPLAPNSQPPPPPPRERPPPPDELSPPSTAFPFHLDGWPNLLRSHELGLAPGNTELPPPRLRHAATFVATASLSRSLGYGQLGLLVVYGGTTDPLSQDPGQLLDDMWAFDLEYRRWTRLSSGGDSPGARMRHSMKADGTLIYLTGGYTFDSDNAQWVNANDVFFMDLVLGYGAVWTRLEGNAQTLARTAYPTALTEGIGVSRRRSHLIAPNNKGIVYVPLIKAASLLDLFNSSTSTSSTKTATASAATTTTTTATAASASGSGSSGASAGSASLRSASLKAATTGSYVPGSLILDAAAGLYDGDLLLLPEDQDVLVEGDMVIRSSLVLHGKVPGASPPPPPRAATSPSPPPASPISPPNANGRRILTENEAAETGGGSGLGAPCDGQVVCPDLSVRSAGVSPPRRQRRRVLRLGLDPIPTPDVDPGPTGAGSTIQIQAERVDAETLRALGSAARAASAASAAAARRILQAATLGDLADVDLDALLSQPRTRVVCTSANSTWYINAAPNFVNIEFVNCHFRISATPGSDPAIFVNCVLRDTVGPPAIVVQGGGTVSVLGTLFLNNSAGGDSGGDSGGQLAAAVAAYGGNGSAIYVQPRGKIKEIQGSVFVSNGNGPNATAGGAIYVAGPDACLATVSESVFLTNGRTSTTSTASTTSNRSSSAVTAFAAGGAIAIEGGGGCDVSFSRCVFRGNSAGLGGRGGAVYMSRTDAVAVTVGNCSFSLNAARSGGGLYLSNVMGAVRLYDTTLTANNGSSRGGGLALEGVYNVNATRLAVTYNSAVAGTGGGIYHSRQGTLRLQDSLVSYNNALYGGGIGGGQDLELLVEDSEVSYNTAAHAGGVECFLCSYFSFQRVQFRGNQAQSGGGLMGMMPESGGALADCVFEGNVGLPTITSSASSSSSNGSSQQQQHLVSDAGCNRDAVGGGGGACFFLRSVITISGGSFVNNTAISGGAVFLQQRCLPGDDGCGPLVISGGTAMTGNSARGGGGGVVFRGFNNLTNVTCGGAAAPLDWSDLVRGCREWVNNTATYGNITATRAYKLQLLSPVGGRLTSYRSNDQLPLEVAAVDFHGQLLLGATNEAATAMEIYSATYTSNSSSSNTSSNGSAISHSVSLAGNSIVSARGVGNFTPRLKLQATPGNYNLQIAAPSTVLPLAPISLTVEVRPCIRGEVTNMVKDQCFSCRPGTFSLDPANLTCDPCPANANCTLPGLTWAALPADGYWSSGAFSPNMVQCPVKKACSGNTTWNRGAAIAAYLTALNTGGTSYDRNSYLGLECAYGYRGTVCGRCLHGYGKRRAGECGPCAGPVTNAIYFALCTCINVVMIALTVLGQLPSKLWSAMEDAPDDGDDVAPQQREAEAEVEVAKREAEAEVVEGERSFDGSRKAPSEAPNSAPGPPPPPPTRAPPALPDSPAPDRRDAASPPASRAGSITDQVTLPGTPAASRRKLSASGAPSPEPGVAATALAPVGPAAVVAPPEVPTPAALTAPPQGRLTHIHLPPLPRPMGTAPLLHEPPELASRLAQQPAQRQQQQQLGAARSADASGKADDVAAAGGASAAEAAGAAHAERLAERPASRVRNDSGASTSRPGSARDAASCSGAGVDTGAAVRAGAGPVAESSSRLQEEALSLPDPGAGGGAAGSGSGEGKCSVSAGAKQEQLSGGDERDVAEGGAAATPGVGKAADEKGGTNDSMVEAKKDRSGGEEEEEEDDGTGPYKGGNHRIVLKILMSYLQVTSMVRQIAMQWPGFITGMFTAAKSASQTVTTIVSIDCSLDPDMVPISIQRTLITISVPFMILLLGLVIWCMLFLARRTRKNSLAHTTTFTSYLRPRLIITTIAIIFYVYSDVTDAFLSLFSCQEVDPPSAPYSRFMEARGSFWSNDLDLACYQHPHLWLVLAVGLPGVVLFALGCPVFSWCWLRQHYDQLYTHKEFRFSYKFMYEDYARSHYYWESVVMLRKLGIVAVVVFLQSQGPWLQVLTALGIIVAAFILQIVSRPYKHPRLNALERLSLLATLAMLYCALYFVSDIPKTAKTAIGVWLMAFNVVVIAFLVYNIAYEVLLGLIWAIDKHSNADGVLTWEDVWVYVDKLHGGKRYTPALVRCLRACETCTGCCYSLVSLPLRSARAAGRYLRDGSHRSPAAAVGGAHRSISGTGAGGRSGSYGGGGGEAAQSRRQLGGVGGYSLATVVPITILPPPPQRMDGDRRVASARKARPAEIFEDPSASGDEASAANSAAMLPGGSGGSRGPADATRPTSAHTGAAPAPDAVSAPPLPITSGARTSSRLAASPPRPGSFRSPNVSGGGGAAPAAAIVTSTAAVARSASRPSSARAAEGGGGLPTSSPADKDASRHASRTSIGAAGQQGEPASLLPPAAVPSRRTNLVAWPPAAAGAAAVAAAGVADGAAADADVGTAGGAVAAGAPGGSRADAAA